MSPAHSDDDTFSFHSIDDLAVMALLATIVLINVMALVLLA